MELKLEHNKHTCRRLRFGSNNKCTCGAEYQAKLTCQQILDLLEAVTNDAELLELKTELGELL